MLTLNKQGNCTVRSLNLIQVKICEVSTLETDFGNKQKTNKQKKPQKQSKKEPKPPQKLNT